MHGVNAHPDDCGLTLPQLLEVSRAVEQREEFLAKLVEMVVTALCSRGI